MNVYALAPLVATIAYIPLLIPTASSRPWQKRHILFFLFLLAAMSWSLVIYLYRSNLFPDAGSALFKLSIVLFSVMAVQFHCFASSFYPKGQKRWLSFAYLTIIPITILVMLGYVTDEVYLENGNVH